MRLPTLTRSPGTVLLTVALVAVLAAAVAENHFVVEPENSAGSGSWIRRASTAAPRRVGCRHRPWVCFDREHPFRRRMCCRNRCVDVGSDENNCGLCKARCPFAWSCCVGICVNTNVNPFHCGGCSVRCPLGVPCRYGLCGYALHVPKLPPTHPGWAHPQPEKYMPPFVQEHPPPEPPLLLPSRLPASSE
ncbi:unnamed protein product [Spirodela intermedia]|uniref:Uncharacterized protein n=2 Tax=Spirodela intermedia TaxID=51605 RepID=A0A7I8ISU7_SPIIN|nr:unnamed protein product [Spirodela intermedia]CAA6660215.1 unnamed protein product [Spirodela intermedia]CAA7396542.1 unnamed protein product [Spirodela intermedia]